MFSSARQPSTLSVWRASLQRCYRYFATEAAGATGPELHDASRVSRKPWPLDPRGEEIRTAKARRLGISTSNKKLNMVAKLVRGLSIPEAERQLVACTKKHSTEVLSTIQAAVKNAYYAGLQTERLIVNEAYVGRGKYLKRLRPWHGKGRFGIEHKKYAHLTVTVRELDEELWEAKVMPQYVHMQYGKARKSVEDDRNHPIHKSDRVSFRSQLDESLQSAKENARGLRDLLKDRGMLGSTTSFATGGKEKRY